MNNVFIRRGASARQLDLLAEWARNIASVSDENFDLIRYIEFDLPCIFPGLHVHIEDDDVMGSVRAFLSEKPLALVLSESIYEGAINNSLFSKEIILHEVGHLFLHYKSAALGLNSASGSYTDRILNTNLANSAEWQATTFALCFLFPFSKFGNARTREQIEARCGVSPRYADRILRHLTRLRMRQGGSPTDKDRRWLDRVLNSISSKETRKTTTKFQSQLLLFFSKNGGLNNPRANFP